jgi:hypothetical protein
MRFASTSLAAGGPITDRLVGAGLRPREPGDHSAVPVSHGVTAFRDLWLPDPGEDRVAPARIHGLLPALGCAQGERVVHEVRRAQTV